jgi:hypothetical protein
MKKSTLALMLVALCCLGVVRLLSQEKSTISVRGGQISAGVVVLDVARGERTFTLQCNENAQDCTLLSNGKYLMIELPKNFGMYECKDVEVYPESASTSDAGAPDKNKKVGEYCLIER